MELGLHDLHVLGLMRVLLLQEFHMQGALLNEPLIIASRLDEVLEALV